MNVEGTHSLNDREELTVNFPQELCTDCQALEARRFAVIVDRMAEAFISINSEWHCTYANHKAEQLLNRKRQHLIGKNIWTIFSIDLTSELYKYCHQAIATPTAIEFEEHYPSLNKWLRIRLIKSEDGLLIYFQDTTETSILDRQLKAEIAKCQEVKATLQKEQDFLKAILNNVQAGIVACDADGILTVFNQAAKDFHGLPQQPVPPTQWAQYYNLYLPDGKTPMNTEDIPLFQALQGHNVRDLEMMIVPQQGTARMLLATGQAIIAANGEKQGAVVVMHDITKPKQVETALREGEAQLSSIFQTIPDGITILDSTGEIIAANKAAERILRLIPSDIVERGYNAPSWFITTVEGHPFPEEELPFARVMQTGEPVYGIEQAISHADGTRTILSINASPLFDAEGQIINIIAAFSDITERKQTEDERVQLVQEQAARAVAENSQQQSAFLAQVSAVLSSSLEYEQTLQSVAKLAVPYFADWCSVDLVNDDRTIDRVAVAHCDPEKVKFGWELAQRFPRHLDDGYGIAKVIQTGQIEIGIEITDEQLVAAVSNAEYLEIIRGVGLKSCIIAPLQARGRVLGSITFVFTESDRRYRLEDIALAEDLAQRAAIAIDNARLYNETQQAKLAAELAANRTARLLAVMTALSESLTSAQVAQVIIEQGMSALGASCGLVAVLNQDASELEIIQAIGYEHVGEFPRSFSIHAPYPLAEAVRTGQPAWLETIENRIARYPDLAQAYAKVGSKAWISVPLLIEGQAVGGLSLSFSTVPQLSESDRAFVLALAQQSAQSIDRARLYESESQARAQSEAANRIKDEFLAVLSHELRTPLNPILGWTRLLRRGNLDSSKTAVALETIERNTKLQVQLIEDLLDISRILQGKLSLDSTPINLKTTLKAAIETVSLAAEAKNIQIETQVEPNVGDVLGDATRLQQVVWNLLTNAIKFTPTGGRVEVELKTIDSYAQIQVRDTGKGIKREFIPYVFDTFRQADSSITRTFGGLGLGLAIVHHVVELHGGTVKAESFGEGQGARFTVTLPLLARSNDANSDRKDNLSVNARTSPLARLCILTVDDEIDNLELVQCILEQAGATVFSVSSATDALQQLTKIKPDVLIADIGMPQMDGYMLIRQVRQLSTQEGGEIPAIALTAYAGETNQQQALAAGFQRHLPKPVEPETLVETIELLLPQIE
ncbi:multi-sensor hybrid histidine kinase [Oscillatoria nigro-viridis PCC 7112]|uniref:Circadian input-output histidine kinase CikA n=1 Tax=Phormidium nigroviride PCC 7112 TaxID=179408 RepID=K9VFW7_9CYAN|nr:PAS domain S-box protein [Oscillatoria nigro-viridis]AFZ06993.1 multi-sensor hybrid histidine kinase [Oscillatoria nigro-viridis PCC 7112]